MRKIKTKDVFKLARIIKLSGAKDEIAAALRATQSGENAAGVGIELLMTLISSCADQEVETSLYELIGDISEEKSSVIKDMDLDELMDTLKEIGEQNNLSNFFDTAVKSV